MGRLFDTTNKTSTTPKSSKGRLFSTPVKKKTVGEKITNTAKAVTKFVGGEKLSEAIGGTIAINRLGKDKNYAAMAEVGKTLPTNKQTLASIGEVALNTVPLGVGFGAGSKVATKVATSIPRLAAEGAAYGASQGGLRAVQEGADVFSGETLKQSAVGGVIGGAAGTVLGRLFKAKPTTPVVNEIVNKIDEIADNSLSKSTTGIKKGTTKYLKENPQEIANREVKLREVDGKVVIEDGRHTLAAAKETGITPKFVDVTEQYTGKKSDKIQKLVSEPIVEQPKVSVTQITPEQPVTPKIKEQDYIDIKKKVDEDYSGYEDFSKSDEFTGADPEYIKQTYATRGSSSLNYIANNGIDDSINVALGKKGVSPDSGFTAPFMKDILLKSGKLTDDQTYRLLNSKAVESMSGSSLQSVSPLQSFIQKANKAVKETYKRKVVANKKTVRSLFEGLEC